MVAMNLRLSSVGRSLRRAPHSCIGALGLSVAATREPDPATRRGRTSVRTAGCPSPQQGDRERGGAYPRHYMNEETQVLRREDTSRSVAARPRRGSSPQCVSKFWKAPLPMNLYRVARLALRDGSSPLAARAELPPPLSGSFAVSRSIPNGWLPINHRSVSWRPMGRGAA